MSEEMECHVKHIQGICVQEPQLHPMFKMLLFIRNSLLAGFLLVIFQINTFSQCTAEAGANQTICSGQSVSLGGAPSATGQAPFSYSWTGGLSAASNPTANPTTTTTYTLTVTDALGCQSTDQVIITVNPSPSVNGGPDIDPCLNAPAVQLPSGGVWSGSSLVNASGLFTPSAVGTYNLTYSVTNVNGCTSSDQVVAVVRPLPTANAGPDQNICAGQSVQLSASGTSPNGAITLYTWSGGSVSNSLSPSPTAAPTNTTTYNVTVVDVEGCSRPDQVTVFVNPIPVINTGGTLTMCQSPVPVALTGATPAGGTWSGTNVSANAYTPLSAGSFTIGYTYTSSAGCTGSGTRNIVVNTAPAVNSGSDYQLCLNSPVLQLNAITPNGTWSGSSFVTPTGGFTPSQSGVYTLTYTVTSGGCSGTDQSTVTVVDRPAVDAGPNTSACIGTGVQLNGLVTGGTPPYAYSWTPNATVSLPNIPNPAVSPTSNTTYIFTVTDANGCSGSDNIFVTALTPPTVNAGPDIAICDQPIVVQMGNFSPAGGIWSGQGMSASGNFVSPGVGTYIATYAVLGSNGCQNTDNRMITVLPAGNLFIGNDTTLCINSSPLTLTPNISGGNWSGSSFISSTGVFTPSAPGNYLLTYTVLAGVCTLTDQINIQVVALPTANAGADALVCPGATALLSGAGSGGAGAPYTFVWQSEEGQILGTGANFSYNPTITSSISLNLHDAAGCSASDDVLVTISDLPTVEAGNTQILCNQPLSQPLQGYSPAGGTWTGVGVTSSGIFTPSELGTFTLTYCVTNTNGCQACDQVNVVVQNAQTPMAGADQAVCQNEQAFNLGDFTSSIGTWSGTGITDASAGRFDPAVSGSGNFTIVLTTGSGSCAASDQLIVHVQAGPSVSAGQPMTVCHLSGEIDLSDGIPAGGTWSGPGVSEGDHHFDSDLMPGNYDVIYHYTEFSSGCSDSAVKHITVASLPEASFSLPTNTCINAPLSISNTSSGANTYAWTIGQSQMGGATPNFTPTSEGSLLVSLAITSSQGCVDTHSATTEVVAAPTPSFSVSTNNGCAPLAIQFQNQSLGFQNLYHWDLGTGQGSFDGATPPTTTYTAQGANVQAIVTLTASNMCGSNSTSQNIEIRPKPIANFNYELLSTICSPVEVSFQNQTVGTPDSCVWNFDNGVIANMEGNSIQVFTTQNNPSNYTIWLRAYNECGVDSVAQSLLVQPNLVHADFSLDHLTGCEPLNIHATNEGNGATQITYDFGGLGTISGSNSSFEFSNEGSYLVYQYATDGCGFDTTYRVVNVMPSPDISFTTDAAEACTGANVNFVANPDDAVSLLWNFGDGQQSSSASASHAYSSNGSYVVQLMGEGSNGCVRAVSQDLPVHPTPVASFIAQQPTLCTPFEFCPENTSIGANAFIWTMGIDGVDSTYQPCHTFVNQTNDPVVQNIILEAISPFGCRNATTSQITILPRPSGYFELSDYSACEFPTQVGTHIIDPLSQSYDWYVDGGFYSNDLQPTFTFSQIGDYQIKFRNTNAWGCADSSIRTFTVHEPVVAAFRADTNRICIPGRVQFYNESENIAFAQWNFGDSAISTQPSPSHVFDTQGVFDITMIAVSPDGCRDTLFMNNFVETYEPPVAAFSFTPEETSIYNPEIEFINQSEDGYTYNWDFGDGFGSILENPKHSFVNPSNWPVTLTAISFFGCKSSITHKVTINNTFDIYIPNAFTPDGDGLNDVFKPEFQGINFVTEYDFQVFNRWGDEIFHTKDPRMAWVGNVHDGDKYTQAEVFNFKVRVKFDQNAQEKILQGTVTMMR